MINEIDKLVTAINSYNVRKNELLKQPSTFDILKDESLNFYAELIAARLKNIVPTEQPKKKKKKEK